MTSHLTRFIIIIIHPVYYYSPGLLLSFTRIIIIIHPVYYYYSLGFLFNPVYYYYYYYFKILGINIRFKRHFPLVRVSKLAYSYEEHVTTHARQVYFVGRKSSINYNTRN